jgi:hypothetical protein
MDSRTPTVVPPSVNEVLRSPGRPLDKTARSFFEPRFGHDFSRVRVHADSKAADSAQAVHASAYTVGNDIVLDQGQLAPGTEVGSKILAHELAHTIQQGDSHAEDSATLQVDHSGSAAEQAAEDAADAVTEARLVPGLEASGRQLARQAKSADDQKAKQALDDLEKKVKATPAFKSLSGADKRLTQTIIDQIRKRPASEQTGLLTSLKQLFDTPVKSAAQISKETKESTADAEKAEKARLARPGEADKAKVEEEASTDPARTGVWVPIKGKFGGGTYYVDRRSSSDIVVKADILLTPKGTGTKKDVDAIKAMEDAIEKSASTPGYTVDIRFVDRAGRDTFKVDVDPSKWETATNWSGGEPLGYAHELHHMFAFELDRYNYIKAHSTNESMVISDRLYWFDQELKKPANYNDPHSIMNDAPHPDDDDACRVAGLDPATCVPARVKARAEGKLKDYSNIWERAIRKGGGPPHENIWERAAKAPTGL